MKRNRRRALAAFSLALLLTVDGALAQTARDLPSRLPAPATVEAARNPEIVLRSWLDEVKVDGLDQPRRVEIVFNPISGETHQRIYDEQDRLISDHELGAQPRATVAEIADAISAVRRDPELGHLARQQGASFDGGFLLNEKAGKPCGPATRCVQIFMLSESHRELYRRAVVDVGNRGRIAHRNYKSHPTD